MTVDLFDLPSNRMSHAHSVYSNTYNTYWTTDHYVQMPLQCTIVFNMMLWSTCHTVGRLFGGATNFAKKKVRGNNFTNLHFSLVYNLCHNTISDNCW